MNIFNNLENKIKNLNEEDNSIKKAVLIIIFGCIIPSIVILCLTFFGGIYSYGYGISPRFLIVELIRILNLLGFIFAIHLKTKFKKNKWVNILLVIYIIEFIFVIGIIGYTIKDFIDFFVRGEFII